MRILQKENPLPNYLGLDGFRGGWVAAWIDEQGGQGFDYSHALQRLFAMSYGRAMIDMPIGLKETGHRICDLKAREMAGASVFTGARRNLWSFADQKSANDHYWKHEGPGVGVSAQLWNIRDKIREVDDFMTPQRQVTIGEAHPELIFQRLAGTHALAGKQTADGRAQRIALLKHCGFVSLEKWLTQRWGTGIGRDDLIDACACAVAARDSVTCLGDGEVDPRGLRMEINY
jgi:predicted RNase H-like nuclease